MFDSILIDIKCPYCSKISEIECQTKELCCTLKRWKKGDFVCDKSIKVLDCIADCYSKECVDYTNKQDGYKSGFGRMFYVDVKLKKGIVTGKYIITQWEG